MRIFALLRRRSPSGRVVLIENPHAGRASIATSPAEILKAAGVWVGMRLLVQELDPARPLGRRWRRQGYVAAVVAGGDATAGAGAIQVAESDLPIGILPLGTSNDIAQSLGVPLDLAQAGAVIAQGIARGAATSIDLGQVVPAQAKWDAPRPTRVWHW